jgi:hypothetical protein
MLSAGHSKFVMQYWHPVHCRLTVTRREGSFFELIRQGCRAITTAMPPSAERVKASASLSTAMVSGTL